MLHRHTVTSRRVELGINIVLMACFCEMYRSNNLPLHKPYLKLSGQGNNITFPVPVFVLLSKLQHFKVSNSAIRQISATTTDWGFLCLLIVVVLFGNRELKRNPTK